MNLQTETVLKLIEMLDITTNDRIKATLAQGTTEIPAASSYYLNGVGYLYKYSQSDNLENAIILFKKAVEEDPNYALAFAALGESYWRRYEISGGVTYVDSAKLYLNRAMDINSELIPVQQTMGLLDLGTGDYDEAVAIFTSILEQEPGNEIAYGGLAEAYDNLGMYEEAEQTYKKAISLKPDYWLSYKLLGNFYLRNGDYQKAIDPLYRVVQLTPDNFDGYSNIGVAYYYQSNWEMAKQYFAQSYEIEPTESAASNLGTVNYLESNYSEAAKYYALALENNPNNYAIWGNLASVQGLLGKEEEERANYEKAIEVAENQLKVNPNDVNINAVLGSYYADIGDSVKSVFYIEKTLRLAPQVPSITFRAASAYENLGNRERAIDLMIKAVEQDYPLENILNQPELSELVSDQRFQELINNFPPSD
ncbi:MAG TPA: hypothetical protein DEG32_00400 [Balneolaceae bacterium]|nr:hypothetical protein [Balneolaceae bacterium]